MSGIRWSAMLLASIAALACSDHKKALVGQWKGTGSDLVLVRFTKDGGAQITSQGKTLEGTYLWASDSSIVLTLKVMGMSDSKEMIVKREGDKLQLCEVQKECETFTRLDP